MTANNNLLSIIVPVYNVEAYLPRCMDSLLTQTYSDIQIVLVDDGSTDRSGYICDEYAERDSRIKVIHKQNGGVTSAWKCGVENSVGDIIGFTDPDDYCDSDYYEILLNSMTQNNADIAVSGYKIEFDNKKIVQVNASAYLKQGIYDGEALKKIKENYFSKSTTLYWSKWLRIIKRELVFANLKYVDEKIVVGDDIGISLATLFDSERIVIVDSYGYHYVQRGNSIMHSVSFKDISNYDRLCRNIQPICSQKGYTENIEREYATQLATVVSKITLAQGKRKDKINGLKELRASEYAKIALKKSNYGNLSKNRRLLLKLFKFKMYGTMLMLARIR